MFECFNNHTRWRLHPFLHTSYFGTDNIFITFKCRRCESFKEYVEVKWNSLAYLKYLYERFGNRHHSLRNFAHAHSFLNFYGGGRFKGMKFCIDFLYPTRLKAETKQYVSTILKYRVGSSNDVTTCTFTRQILCHAYARLPWWCAMRSPTLLNRYSSLPADSTTCEIRIPFQRHSPIWFRNEAMYLYHSKRLGA